MNQPLHIKGLWVPLVTPFNQGAFDAPSLIKLMKEIEPFVEGYVPCLSSGEGGKMDAALWEEVLGVMVQHTNKPVAVGILKDSLSEIIAFSEIAKEYGCVAVVVALQGNTREEQLLFCEEISNKSALP